MCQVSAEGSVEGVGGAPIRDKAAAPRIIERAGLTPRDIRSARMTASRALVQSWAQCSACKRKVHRCRTHGEIPSHLPTAVRRRVGRGRAAAARPSCADEPGATAAEPATAAARASRASGVRGCEHEVCAEGDFRKQATGAYFDPRKTYNRRCGVCLRLCLA
eukprot:3828719-Prymnesium_polylepis.1